MGYPGGFVERLKELMAHVIEHIALELLYIMGENVSFGKAIRVGDSSLYTIVFEYIDETEV